MPWPEPGRKPFCSRAMISSIQISPQFTETVRMDGKLINAVIDRTFIDEDRTMDHRLHVRQASRKRMNRTTQNRYAPDRAVAPGEVLAYELEVRGMTRAELARRAGLTEKQVIAILKGKGSTIITEETAIKLERAIGMPVDYWLNLETNFQKARA